MENITPEERLNLIMEIKDLRKLNNRDIVRTEIRKILHVKRDIRLREPNIKLPKWMKK